MSDLHAQLSAALAGRYTIERELGAGGMATVWLARDLRHDRLVAMKVLRPELAAAIGSERFLREIRIVARLTHPHILPLYDSGLATAATSTAAAPTAVSPSAEFLYYVMPYVAGESLRDRLRREKQLPLDGALQIAREVADALSYAHASGVIHRDIKPENILLEAGHAVVADFGIARAVTAAGGNQLTETGLTLGTPTYMSPEQAAGSRDLDGRSDLYSLGCVLYEMLAGRPPFVGPTVESVVHQHLAAAAPPITTIRAVVPGPVAAVLSRALAKTPADRFEDAAAFAEALATGATAAAGPPPEPLAAARWSWRRIALVGGAAGVAIAGAVVVPRWLRPRPAGHPRTAIAVLPFQNLSAEGPHNYFAGGLHDELLTQLAKVAALSVRGRTSVMGYAGTTKRITQIASELDVGSLVEGSVQVVGDRLRVSVQLVDAATDQHLWAERYDRTLDHAFEVQSDIAQQIVAAVGVALGTMERAAISAPPTADAEAYRLYLQGLDYWRRPGYLRENVEVAQQFFERALDRDSIFALAHAALSLVHGRTWWFRYDPTRERLALQRAEAELALRLAPDLPEAHVAMGRVLYQARGDWQAALDEYQIALRRLPSDAELWKEIGAAHRRLGNWADALVAFETASRLDPRAPDLFYDLGGATYLATRRYAEAVRVLNRALSLAPDLHPAAVYKGMAFVLWRGVLDTLRTALQRLPPDEAIGWLGTVRAQHARLLLWERRSDSLLALLANAPARQLEEQGFLLPTSLYAGWAHQLRGDTAAARAAFDSARVLLDSLIAELPDDWRVHAARGLSLAGLGHRDAARRDAEWLQRSATYRLDAMGGPNVAEARAQILAQIGDSDAALDEVERILGGPSEQLSAHVLRLDPGWDSIRDHPRFQALLVRYANPSPVH